MTVRAPRVSLAPLLSFPRTSSTISAIWSLLFFRKSWPGHRKKRLVKVDSPPALPILRAGIQRSKPDLYILPQTILFLTPYINLKMDLLLIKRSHSTLFYFITAWERQNFRGRHAQLWMLRVKAVSLWGRTSFWVTKHCSSLCRWLCLHDRMLLSRHRTVC